MYTYSVQNIIKHLQWDLVGRSTSGLVICDSRSSSQNANVAHSVFTKMFKQTGNAYPNMVEMPVFGHSKNHAGLQLVDLITSALVFPLACRTYCQANVTGPHVSGVRCPQEIWTVVAGTSDSIYQQRREVGRWANGQ